VPFVTIKNLTDSDDINFTSLNYISPRDHLEFSRRADPRPGDVLVTKDGTLGVARLVREHHPEFSIFVSVAQIRPIAAVLSPRFLMSFFDSAHYHAQMGGLSGGSGLKHIHLEQFRRFWIPLPPFNEQLQIGQSIESIADRFLMEARTLGELWKVKSGLMDDLLTGRVRVTPLLDANSAPA
jgi:type I restriction enzyme, S subunit